MAVEVQFKWTWQMPFSFNVLNGSQGTEPRVAAYSTIPYDEENIEPPSPVPK